MCEHLPPSGEPNHDAAGWRGFRRGDESCQSNRSAPPRNFQHSGTGRRRRLAGALRARKGELARRMLPQVLDGWDKFTTQVEALQGGTDEFIRRELLAFPDYLSLYFQTGDEDYKSLYIGEKRKQFYDAKLDAEARSNHGSLRLTRRPCTPVWRTRSTPRRWRCSTRPWTTSAGSSRPGAGGNSMSC